MQFLAAIKSISVTACLQQL